jgi:hypothetical protein
MNNLLKNIAPSEKNNNFLYSALFALSISYTGLAFGIAIFPYIVSCIFYKKKLKPYEVFLLFLIGLNTSLALHYLFYPISIFFASVFFNPKVTLSKIIEVLSIILIGVIISNSGLIYAQILKEPSHRIYWQNQSHNIENIIFGVLEQLSSVTIVLYSHFTPFFMGPIIIILGFFTQQTRKSISLIIYIIIIFFIGEYNNEISHYLGPLKSITFNRAGLFLGFFIIILGYDISIKYKNCRIKLILNSTVFLYFLFCLLNQTGIIDNFKKNISTKLSYREKSEIIDYYKKKKYHKVIELISKYEYIAISNNPLNFTSYYHINEYKCLKGIIKENRTISIGLDPMVAVFNHIATLDGYHNLYPAKYKNEFRKIIRPILEHDSELRNYYDAWGSRVYVFNTEDNSRIDFQEAKIIGAKYVISRYIILSNLLENIQINCGIHQPYLYKIK